MLCRFSSWTLDVYQEICRTLQAAGYRFVTVADYIDDPGDGVVILRHDIDRFPKNAVNMAEIEYRQGIQATYYVRMTGHVYSRELVSKLHALGHEIGYHYETLSRCSGNMQAAVNLMGSELNELRTTAPVHTIAAHGSPLSKWDNRTVTESVDIQTLDLRGDAYSVIDRHGFAYFTDTGRRWDATSTNLRDRMNTQPPQSDIIHTSRQLMKHIRDRHDSRICIQTHPERWSANSLQLIRSASLDAAVNMVKYTLSSLRKH